MHKTRFHTQSKYFQTSMENCHSIVFTSSFVFLSMGSIKESSFIFGYSLLLLIRAHAFHNGIVIGLLTCHIHNPAFWVSFNHTAPL